MTETTCSIDGCTAAHRAKGFCNAHYQRWRKWGSPIADRRRMKQPCSVEGCDDMAHGHGLCRNHWSRWRKHGDPLWTPKAYDECVVEGCSLVPRSRTAHWCEMHYGRWRRNGDPTRLVEYRTERKTDRGYVMLKDPEHPLSAGRWVYEHRAVLYDVHGGVVPAQCEWCGEPFSEWRDIHVDHLNYDRADNRPENLRASCRSCNTGRHEGSDLETWAVSMATRRILRLNREAFLSEVERLKVELGRVPSSNSSTSKSAGDQVRHAAVKTYQRLSAE